ncbi:MAG: hypothetical protein A3I89_01670 [Candidatus Harrisonbacteria bacterium RIFCSPLOWO2_02_FULL_41_11]|uniref:Uncharacterized protein n=1 Tax=Candidatus Harrisonbacteria bacterium RIFCSPHIGHO2_02_FULL_42_16 TaxID=1798404 RepID=A0A1G1ZJ53_9BACT|nr:MAG: hypothetical protein A3B92_00565 [Candidatus Harrisonbacteria bacterium RIFCSPHIGHO2_02_FULL_42_16]OGY67447.1 MAG: hypothetical protein A3I89_01670 [Candidatus Harrisonbacteria bacterium RIFCSPLOWO2_02_FULL_41_11]
MTDSDFRFILPGDPLDREFFKKEDWERERIDEVPYGQAFYIDGRWVIRKLEEELIFDFKRRNIGSKSIIYEVNLGIMRKVNDIYVFIAKLDIVREEQDIEG